VTSALTQSTVFRPKGGRLNGSGTEPLTPRAPWSRRPASTRRSPPSPVRGAPAPRRRPRRFGGRAQASGPCCSTAR
jgi:hypothetical protein